MSIKIETAVILAAGLGSRLGDLKNNKPKAFLEIAGKSLIERSIRSLISKGVKRIIIGTGYQNQYFDNLKSIYPEIKTHKNSKFDSTGSMYTLYLLKNLISEPLLLLEGDLLYESAALDYLLKDARAEIILASSATESGDEVFIQTDDKGLLQNMSKERQKLTSVDGELVGISKLSPKALDSMCQYANSKYSKSEFGMHYEDAMVGAATTIDFNVAVINDLAWCEIDDGLHLQRALNYVYPKIKQRDEL